MTRANPVEWLADRLELSRGGANENVRPMEGLRGFAVFLVFLVHYTTLVAPLIAGDTGLTGFATAIRLIGNSGVDLFFVLSGYLIYGTLLARAQSFVPFIMRRIQRIYPAFLAVFVIYLGLSFVFPSESSIPRDALEAVLYLIANILLLPGLFPIEPMISVAWSLSYELFYYLTIPLLIAACGLRARTRTWRVSFFLLIAVSIAGYCAAFGGPVRLIMFIAGILLWESCKGRPEAAPGSFVALVALIAALLSALLPVKGSAGTVGIVLTLFICYFVLCFCCFVRPASPIAKSFAWTPLRWLGNMSYSYYLIHGLALKALFLVISPLVPTRADSQLLFWSLLPAGFAITLVPALALFLAIERPLSLQQRRKG